jgi:BASS family bile acid:Na+ symporter
MADLLTTLSNVFTLTFVVTCLLSMGLSLTIPQIVEPLKNVRLVIMALIANFIVVPGAAVLLSRVIPMSPDHQIGLILLASAAGAPFLPKLAQIAKANVPFAVGLMTLLVVVTVVYLPLVLPLVLPGVQIDAMSIAVTLILQILVPLAVGLFVKARWDETAAWLQPHMAQVSNISLALLLVLMLGLNISKVVGLFGSGAILAIALVFLVAMVAGYLLGGPGKDTREVLALGTGQRNMAAAFTIANSNFADKPDVLVLLAAAGLVGMILVMPVAAELGKRKRTSEDVDVSPIVESGVSGHSAEPVPSTPGPVS